MNRKTTLLIAGILLVFLLIQWGLSAMVIIGR